MSLFKRYVLLLILLLPLWQLTQANQLFESFPAGIAAGQELDLMVTTRSQIETGRAHMIHNSGLVILTPFLSHYFTTLEMMKDNSWKDEESAARAVLLTEYLVSGRTEVPNHELILNKIICGIPLHTPVPSAIVLTANEIEISDQLLNAVLQNWEKLSASSVEGLQETFLVREGLLKKEADQWSLDVSQVGVDILISYLPWTISTVSLPWMKQPLETKWGMH